MVQLKMNVFESTLDPGCTQGSTTVRPSNDNRPRDVRDFYHFIQMIQYNNNASCQIVVAWKDKWPPVETDIVSYQ